MSFINKDPADTYKDVLYVDNSNSGVDSTARQVKSGNGADTAITVSDRGVRVKSATDNTSAFGVTNSSGTAKFLVDTTNNYVKANGVHVNTQYAYFCISSAFSASMLANTHYAVPFADGNYPATLYPVSLGTGTDPATSFTTAEGNTTRASDLVTVMWYLDLPITIDAVTCLEGADTATGDTSRMHLFSYDFTSGSTSALANGTLLAHNSDTTNAGSEQAYKSTMTIDSANVAKDKVILAAFRSDSVNSDYSLRIGVRYHITGT
jgi:hypothetical protein